MNFGIVIPKVSMNFGIRLFFLINLKSATKPFNVLLACTHPLITEFALQYKYQKTNSSKRKTNSDNKNQ